MAKNRTARLPLNRLFEKSKTPTFFIGSDRQITYCNQSFLEWTELAMADVIGVRCGYLDAQSSDPISRRLSGLSPPADLFSDASDFRSVCHCVRWESQHFAAQSLPVASDSELLAIMCQIDLQRGPVDRASYEAEIQSNLGLPHRLHLSLVELSEQIGQIDAASLIGETEMAERLRRQVAATAQTDAEFTVVGPAGTEREKLAFDIHRRRRQRPSSRSPVAGNSADQNCGFDMVTIDGAIADTDLVQRCVQLAIDESKSELSHGSFVTVKQPWLLLTNVDRLSPEAQAELWTAVKAPHRELRLIATSAIDPLQLANQQKLHLGLASKISTVLVSTYSLFQRRSDIPAIAQFLAQRFTANQSGDVEIVDPAAMRLLTEFDWPGNLDQLESVIGQAVSLAKTNRISVDHLPQKFHHAINALRVGDHAPQAIQLDAHLANIESKLISRAIRTAKGNKTQAAQLLGISRAKLLRRIAHFNLENAAEAIKTEAADLISPDSFRPLDEPLFEEADD